VESDWPIEKIEKIHFPSYQGLWAGWIGTRPFAQLQETT
jgi:hypothetical protein